MRPGQRLIKNLGCFVQENHLGQGLDQHRIQAVLYLKNKVCLHGTQRI